MKRLHTNETLLPQTEAFVETSPPPVELGTPSRPSKKPKTKIKDLPVTVS